MRTRRRGQPLLPPLLQPQRTHAGQHVRGKYVCVGATPGGQVDTSDRRDIANPVRHHMHVRYSVTHLLYPAMTDQLVRMYHVAVETAANPRSAYRGTPASVATRVAIRPGCAAS